VSDQKLSKLFAFLIDLIACCWFRPHAPWHFPAEFLKHFPQNVDEIPLAKDTFAPIDMPLVAWHTPGDIGGLNNTAFNLTASGNATRSRIYRRAYYAAVAYQDYNIGRLLDTLDELDVAANTVAVVFGDHGWQVRVTTRPPGHVAWRQRQPFEVAD
jgi:arylsulfatase A-like enzyme